MVQNHEFERVRTAQSMPRNLTCIRASLYRVFSLIWPLKTIFVQLSTNISPYILCYDHFCTHLVQVTFTETKANKITTWGMFTENIFTLLQTKGTFRKYNYWRSKRYSSKGVLEEKKKDIMLKAVSVLPLHAQISSISHITQRILNALQWFWPQ